MTKVAKRTAKRTITVTLSLELVGRRWNADRIDMAMEAVESLLNGETVDLDDSVECNVMVDCMTTGNWTSHRNTHTTHTPHRSRQEKSR